MCRYEISICGLIMEEEHLFVLSFIGSSLAGPAASWAASNNVCDGDMSLRKSDVVARLRPILNNKALALCAVEHG